jgi:uncharacterized protein
MSEAKRRIILAGVVMPLIVFLVAAPRSWAQFRVEFGVKIPMRDNVRLAADIWLPKEPGRYPAILVRTPYVKTLPQLGFTKLAQFYASKGYVYVIQDTRGRGDSDGVFDFFFPEGHDGYDTIEWMAAQPWSNGKVGMMGLSYLGTVQWLAAREHPPHLVCITPTAAAGHWFEEIPSTGGAWGMWWGINWLNSVQGRIVQSPNSVGIDMNAVYKHRPLITMDEAFGRKMPLYRQFLEHDTLDAYWKRIAFTAEDFKSITIPALTVTGWFDGDQAGALFYWRNMRALSPGKDNQFLIIGPWSHNQTFLGGSTKQGAFELSADAVYDIKELYFQFFEHFLKGSTSKFVFPRARIYVMGTNKWRDEQEYTPASAEARPLYFHSKGKANTLSGDGALSWESPGEETADHFSYDPANPVASAEGEDYGADQQYIERREDVLVYSSDALKEPLVVVGNVKVVLFAATDGRDTDFTARLIDVFPDGRALALTTSSGIIRARYRNGVDHTELLTPNKTERYEINLNDIGYAFLAGHRLRVEVSSSNYPVYSPNPNTGNPIATDTQSRVAKQTIVHSRAQSSYVSLPVIPNP